MLKKLPAMREIVVQSLGREDPLEKGTDTQCSHLVNSMHKGARQATVHWQGSGQRVGHDSTTHSHTHSPMDQMQKCH